MYDILRSFIIFVSFILLQPIAITPAEPLKRLQAIIDQSSSSSSKKDLKKVLEILDIDATQHKNENDPFANEDMLTSYHLDLKNDPFANEDSMKMRMILVLL